MLDQSMSVENVGKPQAIRVQSFERLVIAVAFITLCVLSYTRNVNWDEFYFLSLIHDWLGGRLDRPMQTGFVHAFAWLNYLPGHEMEQIFAARLVMVGCLAATCLSVHRIAYHLTNERCANVAVLGFLCSGFVLAHGGSFRADPIAAALLTSAIAVAMTSRLAVFHVVAVGMLVAFSFLVTIKSALYLPAFLGVLVWRMDDRAAVVRLIAALGITCALAAILYKLHTSGIVPAQGNETATNANDAVNTTLIKSGLFPRADVILSWVAFSLPQLVLAAIGFASARRSRLILTLLLFISPLLVVVVYRNAFPYFFPFAAPLLMIAVAFGAQRIAVAKVVLRISVPMVVGAAIQLILIAPEQSRTQRATISEVHRLFDAPVPYIGGFGAIATFPRSGFFMSSWGVTNYRRAGQPVFADIIRTQQPPLLLAQRYSLNNALMADNDRNTTFDLLPEDQAVLRGAYVQYSGTIWLAGAETTLSEAGTQISLPFPGRYRVETDGVAILNGADVAGGDVIEVDDVNLGVQGRDGVSLRLVWDTGLAPIARGALDDGIYAGYRRLVF